MGAHGMGKQRKIEGLLLLDFLVNEVDSQGVALHVTDHIERGLIPLDGNGVPLPLERGEIFGLVKKLAPPIGAVKSVVNDFTGSNA